MLNTGKFQKLIDFIKHNIAMPDRKFWAILVIFCLAATQTQGQTLATADCINYAEHTYTWRSSNFIGLSMDLLEMVPEAGSNLLTLYLLNSQAYSSWSNNFALDLHNNQACKYNCTLADLYANTTVNCSFDLANTTFLQQLGNLCWNTTNYYGLSVGWDNEGAAYLDANYMKDMFESFYRAFRAKARQPYFTETADMADTWNATGMVPGYDHLSPEKDCANMNQYLYIYYQAPGITENASSLWFDQMRNIAYECGIFSVRGVVFPNISDLTINNLLSENYTTQYIQRRFTRGGRNYISNFMSNDVFFQDLRLVDNYVGVDGLTNSFAAAIWAVEITIEWVVVEGRRMNFFSPIKDPSFQSVLGQAPNYNPSALFYGLILSIVVNNYLPWIIRPTMTPGTSLAIKVYYLDYWSYTGVLILNKDTNSSRSGTVAIVMSDKTGLHCIYVKAPSLTSTTNITFAGYSFIPGTAAPQGMFAQFQYMPDSTGVYNIPVNYSQMVFCRTLNTANNYKEFPRWNKLSQIWRGVCMLAIVLLLMLS